MIKRKKSFLIRIFFLCCFFLGAVFLSGCTASSADRLGEGKLSVVASIFPPYDFARQLCGENAELTLLISPGMDTHAYSPSPQDIIAIENCDVFIFGGGTSDSWLDDLLDSIDLSGKQVVRMMDCVDLLEEEHKEHASHDGEEACTHDHTESHSHGVIDEHVWTSPVNAMRIVEEISAALQAADPEHAVEYRKRAADYLADLENLDARFRELVSNASRKLLIFADRFPLRYFVEEYGLDYYAAYIGCSTEAEPSAATVAFLIDKINTEKIPLILKVELSNDNIAQTISRDTGAEIRVFQSCHNLPKDDFEAGATYISLMEENLKVLDEALN